MQWSFTRVKLDLPDVFVSVVRTPNQIDFTGALQPGRVWHEKTDAAALLDPRGTIVNVDGASLHWGPPNDVNLHWGVIFGMHAGMGRLSTTSTPLPSGNAFIGGMLGPTFGLVGTATLVAGTSDAGGAMVLGGGVAAQWWPITRLWVRAGPAMVLRFDPGFMNAALRPAAETSASYAFVKVGRFVVDVSLDVGATFVGSDNVTFGLAGVGVAVD